jgi:SAM-dependent methyltransferase
MSVYEQWRDGHKQHVADQEARIASALKCLKLIRPLVNFEKVVDFGCGIGAWLHAAKILGASSVTGIEGEWIRETDTLIDKDLIRIVDLAKETLDLKKEFDLALTIEVGEHLPENAANGFCQSLTSASSYILFSAAVPGQTGLGHCNEQPLPYWVEKFWRLGYVPIEPIRPYIATDTSIFSWLRRNLIMFVDYNHLIRSDALLRFSRPISDFRLEYRPK